MLRYYEGPYPVNHWAMATAADNMFGVGRIVSNNNLKFILRLNPTDSRCYRLLVIYEGENIEYVSIDKVLEARQATWNRSYTKQEKLGLMFVIAELSDLLETKMICVVQVEIAGNNSHSLVDGVFQVGNESEPSLLHAHVILRGVNGHAYIPGVPYRGPAPGELFNADRKDLLDRYYGDCGSCALFQGCFAVDIGVNVYIISLLVCKLSSHTGSYSQVQCLNDNFKVQMMDKS
jgi:hypothetical protein